MCEQNMGHTKELPALYREHLLLGARFGEGMVPLAYGGESAGVAGEARANGALLSDVSHVRAQLLWGGNCAGLAHVACAGKPLKVGECAFEAVLTGDGALTSVPLVARTGEAEYLVLDLSERAEVLMAWLEFLMGVSQDGFAPYADVETQDVSKSHVALVLWGARASQVLGDYVSSARELPSEGQVASVLLDRIPVIALRVRGMQQPCYVLMVPPASAVALWRSFLSFGEVTPVGIEGLGVELSSALSWYADLSTTDVVRLPGEELRGGGLVRAGDDFVGARGL